MHYIVLANTKAQHPRIRDKTSASPDRRTLGPCDQVSSKESYMGVLFSLFLEPFNWELVYRK